MSCECEKLRDLYERMVPERMEVLSNMYSNAIGNGADVKESQMLKTSYESDNSPRNEYSTSNQDSTPYGIFPGKTYDIAPAKMPIPNQQKQKPSELETKTDKLAEMITAAREEQEWMSIMQ